MAEKSPNRRDRARRNRALQLFGILFLGLVIAEGLAGSALMTEKPFAAGTLALHIALALVMVWLALWAFRVALRLRGWRPPVAALLALLSTAGATMAGAAFLLGGEAPGALHWMEGCTGGIIVAGVLLLVWGAAFKRGVRETEDGEAGDAGA